MHIINIDSLPAWAAAKSDGLKRAAGFPTAGRLPANRRRKHTLCRNRPRGLARHGLHPAQRRSHPPRQRRSWARDIQRRQKPSPLLRSGGNGAGMERRNRAIPHRQQPPTHQWESEEYFNSRQQTIFYFSVRVPSIKLIYAGLHEKSSLRWHSRH